MRKLCHLHVLGCTRTPTEAREHHELRLHLLRLLTLLHELRLLRLHLLCLHTWGVGVGKGEEGSENTLNSQFLK